LECRSDVFSSPDCNWGDFEAEPASLCLGFAHFQHGLGIVSVKNDCKAAELRQNLTQEF
jgi:hypothetical protein